MNEIYILLLMPIIASVLISLIPACSRFLDGLYIGLFALVSFSVYYVIYCSFGGNIYAFEDNFFLDALGMIFLFIIATTGFLAGLYATHYFNWEIKANTLLSKDKKRYYVLSFIFVFTMIFSTICNNIIFLWVGIEATTLASIFLVVVHKDKKSLEAGYKYAVICSVGLAFALFASVLLYSVAFSSMQNAKEAILFTSLMQHAQNFDTNALKLIFIFALIGYGTKAGFVPTHTWLPDAHAQGPAPTSAMLSGILLKCALLALLRFYAIIAQGVGVEFVQNVMIVSGVATLFVSGFFLITQHDVKRMFAYHSIAHMGVIAFALGVGGLGVLAALFHAMAHSFTKALAFLSTGNIARIYGTKDMRKMGSMIKVAPLSAILFGISICSLVGVPAFAIFVSEFLTFKAAALKGEYILMGVFALALCIIFVADFSHFFLASFGKVEGVLQKDRHISFFAQLPLLILAFLIISFGVYEYESIWHLLFEATKIVIPNQGVQI